MRQDSSRQRRRGKLARIRALVESPDLLFSVGAGAPDEIRTPDEIRAPDGVGTPGSGGAPNEIRTPDSGGARHSRHEHGRAPYSRVAPGVRVAPECRRV